MAVKNNTRGTAAAFVKTWLLPAVTMAGLAMATALVVRAARAWNATAAPGFVLTDQQGRRTSLAQFRGKVVALTFLDPECTQVCPLLTQSMAEAVRMLGPTAAARVELLGVNVNLAKAKESDVAAYTRAHALPADFRFLTGSAKALESVWNDYHIYVSVSPSGDVEHTAVVYIIGPDGQERFASSAQEDYGAVGVQANQLAQLIARTLPGGPGPGVILPGPPQESSFNPTQNARFTSLGAQPRSVIVGPGHSHLLLFFAGWLGQQFDLAKQLAPLDAYASAARQQGWPSPLAVDELTTEPSVAAARRVLAPLAATLRTPVVEDTDGSVADAYSVGDLPWFALISSSGKVLWSHDGWLTAAALNRGVRTALHTPAAPESAGN